MHQQQELLGQELLVRYLIVLQIIRLSQLCFQERRQITYLELKNLLLGQPLQLLLLEVFLITKQLQEQVLLVLNHLCLLHLLIQPQPLPNQAYSANLSQTWQAKAPGRNNPLEPQPPPLQLQGLAGQFKILSNQILTKNLNKFFKTISLQFTLHPLLIVLEGLYSIDMPNWQIDLKSSEKLKTQQFLKKQ